MESYGSWLNNTLESISSHKQTHSKKDVKKYKLDYLARMSKRIADLSKECGECQKFQGDISKLVQDLGRLIQTSKEEKKNYDKKTKEITTHLQKKHKLVAEGLTLDLESRWAQPLVSLSEAASGISVQESGLALELALPSVAPLKPKPKRTEKSYKELHHDRENLSHHQT